MQKGCILRILRRLAEGICFCTRVVLTCPAKKRPQGGVRILVPLSFLASIVSQSKIQGSGSVFVLCVSTVSVLLPGLRGCRPNGASLQLHNSGASMTTEGVWNACLLHPINFASMTLL